MKLHILSDLHFEFQKWPRGIDINAIDADVTILAGDIGIGLQGIQWALERIRRPVIYVMGNHEYFGQRPISKLLEKAKRKCAGTHVQVLDNEGVVIDGVRFLGATLWTDFALFGIDQRDAMMAHAQSTMTDYALIHATRKGRLAEPGVSLRHLGDRITPQKTLGFHEVTRRFLETELALPSPASGDHSHPNTPWRTTVVVSHHAPSVKSLENRCAQSPDEATYASHLEPLIEQCALWVHGHVHVVSDYRVGPARVVANPRGYVDHGPDAVAHYDPALVVEV